MRIPKITLSNIYRKGSVSDRVNTALSLNEEFFSKIYSLYENTDYVSIRDVEKILKKVIPESIYFKVRKLNPDEAKKFSGGLVTYFCDKKLCSYQITIIAKDNKLHISNLPTFMHECMHFFERLLNPKLNKEDEKILSNSLIDTKNRLISKFYYNNQHYSDNLTNKMFLMKTKRETKKELKNFKSEDKIRVLHYIRNAIQSEIIAFDETNKYAKKLRANKWKYKWIDVDKYYKSYMFKEKLDIINSMLKDTIKKERCKKAYEHSDNIFEKIKLFFKSYI